MILIIAFGLYLLSVLAVFAVGCLLWGELDFDILLLAMEWPYIAFRWFVWGKF